MRPSQPGIFLDKPQMQSCMPLPSKIREVQASMRDWRVCEFFEPEKCNK
jgi:hypothetical protein